MSDAPHQQEVSAYDELWALAPVLLVGASAAAIGYIFGRGAFRNDLVASAVRLAEEIRPPCGHTTRETT